MSGTPMDALPPMLYQQLDQLDLQLRALWDDQNCIPPTPLFHYTTADGLDGIISEGEVWATDARFLNDTSELDYGRRLFLDYIKRRKQQASPQEIVFLDALQWPVNFRAHAYIACFCEHGDLLSQWRGYGAINDAYAIGFDFSALHHRQKGSVSAGGRYLQKVIYDPARQEQLIDEVVCAHLSIFAERVMGLSIERDFDIPGMSEYRTSFRIQAHALCACFKHPTFEVEREWRLVEVAANDGGSGNRGVRIKQGRFTPFAKWKLEDARVPIVEIRYGPTAHPELTKAGLQSYLRSKGREDIKISGTEVPLRTG